MIFQNYEALLYGIGLALVLLYISMGVDDFTWDMTTAILRRFRRQKTLQFNDLESIPPKLLAITVAAWHEQSVLGDVVDNIIASTSYPQSMYHIFLGVYPNDAATIKVAQKLADIHDNVHVIINNLPGPTSKAQNINHVIRQIRIFEKDHEWEFASLTIHDSEDVVHPYELLVTNYLIETHDALQFPVFPLLRKPTLRNFFKNITTSTYADEFAENHYTTMVNRYIAHAFVPSAGTGFVLTRKTLAYFGNDDVLPSNSLTEDYRLALTLFENHIRMYYVLEKIPRINNKRKVVWDFVTTRSMFPNTFQTAVKQKTRWILGITMQSIRFRDIFLTKDIPFSGRYSLYKDLKAKIGNLLAMIGYPVLVYFLISLFLPLQPIYPRESLSWWLSLAVSAMMIERQIFRSIAIFHVYGLRSVFFACFFPPLLPIRLIWGNIINLVATVKAYRQRYLSKKHKDKKQSKAKAAHQQKTPPKQAEIKWAKTDHSFLGKNVLRRYQRTIGDILLERGYITTKELQKALKSAAKSKQRLGEYLQNNHTISEDELLDALSRVQHMPFVTARHLEYYGLQRFAKQFDELLMRTLHTLPLMPCSLGFVFAMCDDSPDDAQAVIEKTYGIKTRMVFFSRKAILEGLDIMYRSSSLLQIFKTAGSRLFEAGKINCEQLILARNYAHRNQTSEDTILHEMGLLPILLSPDEAEHNQPVVVYSGFKLGE